MCFVFFLQNLSSVINTDFGRRKTINFTSSKGSVTKKWLLNSALE